MAESSPWGHEIDIRSLIVDAVALDQSPRDDLGRERSERLIWGFSQR